MASVNLNHVELDWRQDEPGYSWQAAVLGPALGASRIGATLYELPPGQASSPYHYEYGCREWLLVLTGEITLRDPEGERALAAGDVVCFPEGPQGAHRVANHGQQPAPHRAVLDQGAAGGGGVPRQRQGGAVQRRRAGQRGHRRPLGLARLLGGRALSHRHRQRCQLERQQRRGLREALDQGRPIGRR